MALQFRDILHVDVDAFFASVEQALDPALEGKPVIVAGDPDGRSVVASASYEARRYGVRSAMPVAQARRLCPQGLFVTGHFEAYGEFSERIGDILRRFAPVVQPVSLDDFYLDLTGCRRLHGPPLAAAERMKFDVRAATGLSVTIGIAANKLVAKIASDLAKPNGILEVGRGAEAAFLRNLPVETLPGVGPSTAETLRRFNLASVGDIARLPAELLQKTFGVAGLALWEHARGCDDSPVVAEAGRPKSVSREHTFAEDTMDHEQVRSMLYYLIEHAARSLREECLLARRVTVKVCYSDFRTVTAARTLCAPTDEDRLLYDAAAEKLSRLVERRMRTRLVGVALSGLLPSGGKQGDLFAGARAQRRRRFYRELDGLRGKFGFGIAVVGPSLRLIQEDEKGGV